MDFTKDVLPILKEYFPTFVNVVIFGIIVWGIERIITHSAKRKFADYKKTIDLYLLNCKNEFNRQMEQYKSELKFLNDRQASLHSERFKIIKELNDILVKLNSAMRDLVYVNQKKDIEDHYQKEILDNAQKIYAGYNNFILFNKIYFNKELADKLEKIKDEYYNAQWDFFGLKRLKDWGMEVKDEEYKNAVENVINASKKIKEQIPQLITEVEDDFRKILGVDK